jgi:hypothetical protein
MKTNAKVLAETLFTEAIQKKHCDVPPGVRIAPTAAPAIEAKIQLYQFTSVLMAVIATAQTKPEFIPVREHLERLFFSPRAKEGADLHSDIWSAMNDLTELLTCKNASKSMFWSRDWLLAVGVEENNPATLDLFTLRWMDYYITIMNSPKDFDPVA